MIPNPQTLHVEPLNPDLIRLSILFLEKYDLLADQDKQLYRKIIAMVANPLLVVGRELSEEEVKEAIKQTKVPLK
jgi:hypothetical protein